MTRNDIVQMIKSGYALDRSAEEIADAVVEACAQVMDAGSLDRNSGRGPRWSSDMRTRYDEIYLSLDGLTALAVAEATTMGKVRDEKDTAFVKRIVATYLLMAERACATGTDAVERSALECPNTVASDAPAGARVQESPGDALLGQAKFLARCLWLKHWKDDAPNWKMADNLQDVLLQIDNMTVGLVRPTSSVPSEQSRGDRE